MQSIAPSTVAGRTSSRHLPSCFAVTRSRATWSRSNGSNDGGDAQATANGELEFHADTRPDEQPGFSLRTVFRVLATGACYYLATRTAWVLTFPDSKVSLFFPPHAVLVSILLLVPTRHWWAYTLAAASSHFFATQQAGWPPLYALQCEAFDAVKYVLTAAGIRIFIKSPFHLSACGKPSSSS